MFNNGDGNTTELPTAEQSAQQCIADQDLRSPCYCEENAWRLVYRHLKSPELSQGWHYHVVFISNRRRCCLMFHQKAADERGYVCWDYHVVVFRTRAVNDSCSHGSAQVLDIDTNLSPYPSPLEDYLDGSFPHATTNEVGKSYLPLFRVVDAREYLRHFYSDRSHMYKDGRWSAPPPSYKPIMNGLHAIDQAKKADDIKGGNMSNLEYYINMSEQSTRGENLRPLTLDELRARFAGQPDP